MAYLASTLITRSWHLSKIVARNLQVVSGDQINDGLDLLNYLLEFKASDLHLIPYFNLISLNLIAGQEIYFVPNLYDVETMTFNIGTIRYEMIDVARRKYFGSSRVDNLATLPGSYHVERLQGGSNIYVYPLPYQNFPAHVMGKFALTDVTLNTNLLTVYDGFYIEYLRHALAEYMCNEYSVTFPPGPARKLEQIINKLADVSAVDLSTKKVSSLGTESGFTYGDANLGHGWRPN